MRSFTRFIRIFRARTILHVVVGLAACDSIARAAEPTLTTLRAVRTLTLAQARLGIPIAFQATVTYYNPDDVDLFVQDNGEALYVDTKQNQKLQPGDRVLVRGRSRASFTPDVVADSVTVLRHGSLPRPLAADFRQLIRAERDCMLVTVHATVRSADTISFSNTREVSLRLLMDGGYIDASVIGVDPGAATNLLDANVDVTGVVSGKFDSKMQLIGIVLEVPTLADVKIVRRVQRNPESLPVTSMDKVMSAFNVFDRTERVRVQGTITYYQPGSAVVLQNGADSIWIAVHTVEPLEIGDKADATGFPDPHFGFLALADGEIQDSHVYAPVQPVSSNWHDLTDWNSGNAEGHQNDLVSIEGRVVAAVREQSQDEFDLISSGKLFTAIYHHPYGGRPLPRMKQVPIGATIRVTGICMVVQGVSVDPSVQEVPFNILLRSYDDLAVVADPPLLSIRNLLLLVGLLVALLFAAGTRAWIVERRMRRQNATAALIERRRSRILEDINVSRPLAAIIEQIVDLASVRLCGAPCWCQIVDGARLGNCPANLNDWRIVDNPISGRSGAPLGVLYAAFDAGSQPAPDESAALSVAAGLATLAIETRRLYSDLVHRSEFDLLTDIPNRFSLESFLDEIIEQTRRNAGMFGLVYIDLNEFKQVNDLYGHQAGDLYLREFTARMQQQIRSGDMLARIGGDEFAIVLPNVRRLAEVQEVAQRLERCMDPPFDAGGGVVYGSASVGIALYPDDGTTRDSLLSAADAAMYVNKQTRRVSDSVSFGQNDSGPTLDDRS
jgi:diguanylate cyclase (GGDEF)-like protein